MKRVLVLLFTIFFLFSGVVYVKAHDKINLYLFWHQACPHCKEEMRFIDSIKGNYGNLQVNAYEITNPESLKKYKKALEYFEVETGGVPLSVIGKEVVVGFATEETTGKKIKDLIDYYEKNGDPDVLGQLFDENQPTSIEVHLQTKNSEKTFDSDQKEFEFSVPILGKLNALSLPLPLLTFTISLVDGFNPCAMWVLLFLVSMLLGMKSRVKMWALGLTFIMVSGAVYFLFMIAWLKVFFVIGYVGWLTLVVGLIAVFLGILQIKSYFKNKVGGCEVVDNEQRKKIFQRIKYITNESSFIASMAGIAVLAVMVNMIEFVCSFGLPALYTQVLSLSNLPKTTYYLYLLLYVFVFMLDDVIVFSIAMITLRVTGIESKYANLTKLIGGLLVLLIGILLIVNPSILTFSAF